VVGALSIGPWLFSLSVVGAWHKANQGTSTNLHPPQTQTRPSPSPYFLRNERRRRRGTDKREPLGFCYVRGWGRLQVVAVQGGHDQVRVLQRLKAHGSEGPLGARPFPPPRTDTLPPLASNCANRIRHQPCKDGRRREIAHENLCLSSRPWRVQVAEIVQRIRESGLAKLGGSTPANTIVGQLSKGARATLFSPGSPPPWKKKYSPAQLEWSRE